MGLPFPPGFSPMETLTSRVRWISGMYASVCVFLQLDCYLATHRELSTFFYLSPCLPLPHLHFPVCTLCRGVLYPYTQQAASYVWKFIQDCSPCLGFLSSLTWLTVICLLDLAQESPFLGSPPWHPYIIPSWLKVSFLGISIMLRSYDYCKIYSNNNIDWLSSYFLRVELSS
jgi:hypothetical protein